MLNDKSCKSNKLNGCSTAGNKLTNSSPGGQLSAFEEKRLKRNYQLPHLNQTKKDLEEKLVENEIQEREEDRQGVSRFLEKKEAFEKMVDSLCNESKEAFKLTLPAYVKKQLHENVRLRRLCNEETEKLLEEQDRSRYLAKLENSLRVEKETQIYTEDLLKSQEEKLNSDLESLFEAEAKLRFVDNAEDEENITEKKIVIHEKFEDICKTEDELTDLSRISNDQGEYKLMLEKQLTEKIDLNGRMVSAILRAGKIVHSRLEEVGNMAEYDYEFLRQINMLLDDFL